MKKLIMYLIVCLIVLSCGCTPNLDFEKLVMSLDTPTKIGEWLTENITYESHHLYPLTPIQLYYTGLGDCDDTAIFGMYVANLHGYTTYKIKICYSDTWILHMICVYDEGMLSYTDNWVYTYGFDTFLEIVQDDDRFNQYTWETYKVYDYDNNIIERGIK